MEERSKKTSDLVLMGLFAALFVIAFFIKIPIGDRFVHFANVFAMLAVLVLGTKKGVLSVLVGVFLADLVSGYIAESLPILILYAIKTGVAGIIFSKVKDKYPQTKAILLSIIPGFLAYMVFSFIYKTALLLIAGSDLSAALGGAAFSQIASLINLVSGALLVPVIYPVFKRALKL